MRQSHRASIVILVFCVTFAAIYWVSASLAQGERDFVDFQGRPLPHLHDPGLAAPGLPDLRDPTDDHIFADYTTYPAGAPDAVGIGDFNNDGLNDVATSTGTTLRVFLQQPNGILTNSVNYASGTRSESLGVGDFNDDGRDDIVTLNFSDDDISIFLQEPDGTMAARVIYNASNGPDAVTVGDLNNDGRDDIAVSHWLVGNIRIFYQQAGGTLQSTPYSSPQAGWDDIDIGDFNDDALGDVVKLNGQGINPDLSLYLQNGGGGLNGAISYDLPGGNVLGSGVATGDLTGDGLIDLAVTRGGNRPSSKLVVFAQTITGTLEVDATYDAYDIPEPVEIADVNLDGRLDVIVAHGGWNRIGLFIQNTDGTLAPYELYPIPYASHYGPQGLDLGDINNDCAPDVVIADYNNGLVVLYNELPSFLVTAQPDAFIGLPGETLTATVFITPANGFTGSVSLSLPGLSNSNYSFADNPVNTPGQTELTLSLPLTMSYGTYPLQLRGDGNDAYCQDDLSLEVGEIVISGLTAVNDSPTLIGNTTSLTASITAGNNVSYTWNLGDGTFGGGAIISHTYSAIGTYTAVVTAANSLNSLTATTLVEVLEAPISGLTAVNDSPTLIGNTTMFTASIITGNNVSYTWHLGEGTIVNGSIVSHTYNLTGTYTAVVTASNSNNVMTATTVVTVNPLIIPPQPENQVFLPLVLGPAPATEFEAILIGQAIPSRPVTAIGETFYLTAVSIPNNIPTYGRYYLSASPTQVQPILVDDEILIQINATVDFSHQFSNPGDAAPTSATIEIPLSVMQTFGGQTIIVSYQDIFGDLVSATEIWLIWTP